MKTKLFTIIAVIAVVITAGYNISITDKTSEFSDLLLENIEALALPGDEIGPAPGDRYACGYFLSYGGVGILRACESCFPQFGVKYALSYGYCGN